LVELLTLVGAAVPARTPKPVLTCVKLSALAGTPGLTVAGTDLEVALSMTTPRVEVQEPGETLLSAEKIGQIVRETADTTLTLETEGEQTHIRGQDSHFKIMGYAVSEFPPLPQFTGEADFEIAGPALSQLVQQTIYAAARENSRYAFNGVLIEREGNKLSVVATDGHRLAIARGDCSAAKGDNRSAIVPTKALNMLLRVLGGTEQVVKVKIAENQVLFATPTAVLSSTLVEGNFPPYKDVVPKGADKKATVSTEGLASAFRRAALLTNEESKGVRMAFQKDGLTLTSRAPEMGEAEIKVELPAYEGEPVEIGFNPHYILDALKVAKTPQVTLEMRAGNKPGVLRTGADFLYVVMPVNLQ
jgi:DNA polymerase-3 subunit beta